MSEQEFKPGDRVRCIETWTTHVIDSGDEFTVEDIDPTTRNGLEVFVQGEWVPARYFEKVEPEFVVGQQVSGDDFASLPVGTVVEHHSGVVRTKSADGRWVPEPAHFLKLPDDVMESQRTITHLPDAAEPEDKDDLYVEPEPLKEGDWYEVLARFDGEDSTGRLIFDLPYVTSDGRDATVRNIVRADAIVRPSAGQVPPWLEAEKVESEAIANIAEVLSREGDMDYDAASPIAASLYRAGVRITEGGAS